MPPTQLLPAAVGTREIDHYLETGEDVPPALLDGWVEDAVARACALSPRYRAYVDRVRSLPEPRFDAHAPLLPSGVFKTGSIDAELSEGDALVTQSSGTMGTRSRVPRDDLTLMRLLAGLNAEIRRLLEVESLSRPVGVLAESPSDDEPTWLSYLIHLTGAAFDSFGLLAPGGGFDDDALDAFLAAAATNVGGGCIAGPPAYLVDLADHVRRRRGHVPPETFVLAIGGWKARGGRVYRPAEVRSQVTSGLGLDEHRFRDTYSMVEINTLILECRALRKHVPTWLRVEVLDPRTGRRAARGEDGVLCFWDPTAQSYPGFVMSDDVGVLDDRCSCGAAGPVVEVVGRVNRTEGRGCAAKLSDGVGRT